jgi:hypothetical protein
MSLEKNPSFKLVASNGHSSESVMIYVHYLTLGVIFEMLLIWEVMYPLQLHTQEVPINLVPIFSLLTTVRNI